MGLQNLKNSTESDLLAANVSKREHSLIMQLLELNPEIFRGKEFLDSSAFSYAVDLTKIDQSKLSPDMKKVVYRPTKMRLLYESYWRLASELEKEKR